MHTTSGRGGLLELDRISKRFGPVAALTDVSVSFQPGRIHAICGENGAGKSTLVGVLSGLLRPDQGEIRIDGRKVVLAGPRAAQRHGVALVAQELSICPDLTVFDNLWLGSIEVPFMHRRAELRQRGQAAMAKLGLGHIGLNTPARELSLGQRQLVEIARALLRRAHTIILDEPTAALSDAEIGQVFAALEGLRSDGCTVIYVSHRLGEVFAICATVTVMRNGRAVCTRAVAELSRDQLIESMLGRATGEMFPAGSPGIGGCGLQVRGLRVADRVEGFDVVVPRGHILCIAGQIGSGATDVVRALAGQAYDAEGEVSVSGRPLRLGSVEAALKAGVMLISGDRARDGIFLDLDLIDNLVATALPGLSRFGLLVSSLIDRFAFANGRKAGVDMSRARARARQLSGGNQQKLAFARLLGSEAGGILVMDEPTRGIDVGARADIYRLTCDFCRRGFAIVIASSDLEEIVGLGDQIVTMYRGRIVGRHASGAVDVTRIVAEITHPTTGAHPAEASA